MNGRESQDSPFFELTKYGEHAALDSVPFVGTLRKHPYDPEKCLFLTSRQDTLKWLEEGVIIEFRIKDVTGVDELPSPVDSEGNARQIVRLWVRRGSIAMRYDPFEVNDTMLGPRESETLRRRISRMLHPDTEMR